MVETIELIVLIAMEKGGISSILLAGFFYFFVTVLLKFLTVILTQKITMHWG